MKRHGSHLSAFLLCMLLVTAAHAQERTSPSRVWQEAGLPYFQNFSPKDYSGGIQNFAIAQDRRGLMDFANTAGVLIYDGVSWRLIKMPNQSAVRSLRVVKERVYVGAVGELGYLAPDATGRLHFTSLRNEIPETHRNFEDVYSTLALGNTVYFSIQKAIFRRAAGQMRVWTSTSPMQHVYVANRRLYVLREGVGLMHRNASRLLQLINQLLDLSRLEAGKMKLNARRSDFIAVLKGIVMSFASLAEQKKIMLTFTLPPQPGRSGTKNELTQRLFSAMLCVIFA